MADEARSEYDEPGDAQAADDGWDLDVQGVPASEAVPFLRGEHTKHRDARTFDEMGTAQAAAEDEQIAAAIGAVDALLAAGAVQGDNGGVVSVRIGGLATEGHARAGGSFDHLCIDLFAFDTSEESDEAPARAWASAEAQSDKPVGMVALGDGDERPNESAAQVEKLAAFIMEHVPGEPSESQGAVDTAIRILETKQDEVSDLEDVKTRLEEVIARQAERIATLEASVAPADPPRSGGSETGHVTQPGSTARDPSESAVDRTGNVTLSGDDSPPEGMPTA